MRGWSGSIPWVCTSRTCVGEKFFREEQFMNVIFLMAFWTAEVLCAQSETSVVRAKRVPPGKASPTEHKDVLDKYDFGAQVVALQAEPHATPGASPNGANSSAAQGATGVPSDFKPKTDVQLTQTAKEAVQMSETWMAEHNQIAAGPDGRVLYSYGAGLP